MSNISTVMYYQSKFFGEKKESMINKKTVKNNKNENWFKKQINILNPIFKNQPI